MKKSNGMINTKFMSLVHGRGGARAAIRKHTGDLLRQYFPTFSKAQHLQKMLLLVVPSRN